MCNKFAALLLILLCGCTTWRHHQSVNVEIANGVNFKLIDLQTINQNISLKQRVHGNFEELFFNLTVITKLTPQSLEIIGVAPVMGTRIFTLKYDGKTIGVEHSKFVEVDPRIKPEYIIADMQLTYADIGDVIKNFDKNIKVVEKKEKNGLLRIISKKTGNAKISYKTIIEIHYSGIDRAKSNIEYKHLERGYEYIITNPK